MEIKAGSRVAIFGATSDIAAGFIRLCAARKATLFLVGRNEEALESIAADARVRGATVSCRRADLSVLTEIDGIVEQGWVAMGQIDVGLIAHGTLSDNDLCLSDALQLDREIRSNFTSAAALLGSLAKRMVGQNQKGSLAVITSVAGDRGRQSNFVYGSSKAGLNEFCSGLRQQLCSKGIEVLTIKPGFVATKMTAHLKQGPLFASADAVAAGIMSSIEKGRSVVYLPWFWLIIMTIIRMIPEPIFKRLRL
jgi:decaprenylphospho-beta-D-erythro-pentofuranosid-2-ulose 2-reductase